MFSKITVAVYLACFGFETIDFRPLLALIATVFLLLTLDRRLISSIFVFIVIARFEILSGII
jgi:hypothetical protein